MEQMMEGLIAGLGGLEAMIYNPAKPDVNLKEIKEEMLANLEDHHERMMARMASQLEKMEVCLVKMEATELEANPEEKEIIAGAGIAQSV
jgi:hypothetical protein